MAKYYNAVMLCAESEHIHLTYG